MSKLGRLERVDLRDIWKTEAQDFTPWLAGEENLALLSDTLGIDLELEAVERNVGPFRADILCKDLLSEGWVLIENQLERTDHTHLGQLMTYAAGLDAVTIVWVAATFADEHRAAMDWLNEITGSEVRFFALEVELWKIGDSPAAPKFNIVSKPNDWSNSAEQGARESGSWTELKQQYLSYWIRFREYARSVHPDLRFSTPKPSQYIDLGIGAGAHAYCGIRDSDKSIRCGVILRGKSAKAKFHRLMDSRDEIETELGFTVEWQEKPEKQRSALETVKRKTDPTEEIDWPVQHEWLLEHISKLRSAILKRVPVLKSVEEEEEIAG